MAFIHGTLCVAYQSTETTIKPIAYAVDPYTEGNDPVREENRYLLKQGDLVTVFGSVVKSDVHWQGTIDMERLDRSARGIQKDIDQGTRAGMFSRSCRHRSGAAMKS